MRVGWLVFAVVAFAVVGSSATADADAAADLAQGKNYYEILGVDINASAGEIKKSYRKLALLHHPDKHIPGNDTDKEVRHKMFVLLANAYQVVSDEVIRNRYNFLLSKGKLVYEENHNWEEFDAKQARAQGDGAKTEFYSRVNADGKKVFVFRDAFQQFEEAAEERALLLSFVLSLAVGFVPYIMYRIRRRRERNSREPTIDKNQVKEDQRLALEARAAAAAEAEELRQQHLEDMRELRRLQEEARRKAEAEGAFDGPVDPDAEPLDGVGDGDGGEGKEGGGTGAGAGAGGKKKLKSEGGPGQLHACALCNKKYKSEQQLEQHFASKDHRAAEKKMNRTAGANAASSGESASTAESSHGGPSTADNEEEKRKKKDKKLLEKQKKKAQLSSLTADDDEAALALPGDDDDGQDDAEEEDRRKGKKGKKGRGKAGKPHPGGAPTNAADHHHHVEDDDNDD